MSKMVIPEMAIGERDKFLSLCADKARALQPSSTGGERQVRMTMVERPLSSNQLNGVSDRY